MTINEDSADPTELVRHLSGRVGALQYPPELAPSEAIGLASALRCMQLVDEMAIAARHPLAHLVQLGVRPILDTTIEGLYYLLSPNEWRRSLVGDKAQRLKAAKALGLDPAAIEATFDESAIGTKGPPSRDQMLDRIGQLPGHEHQAERIREAESALYDTLSRVSQHGGIGAVEAHLGQNPDGIVVTPNPAPLLAPDDAVRIAGGLTGILLGEVELALGAVQPIGS